MFKTRLDTFENTFGHFWNFENIFCENFRKLDPPRNTGQKKISKSLPQNTFKTRLDSFANDFGHFWNFEKKNWKIFENSTLHGTLGIKFFRKNHPITGLDTFGNTFGQFWNFENIFFENFRRLDPPWNTGHKIFQKVCPKTCSKHVLRLLGTLLGIFGILKKKN